MLTLRLIRRFGAVHRNLAAAAFSSFVGKISDVSSRAGKPSSVDEPALVKLKKERDPEKLFNLFKANATNKAIDWFLNDVPGRFGIVLDAYSFNIVIKGFCEMGILDKAFLVMAGMGTWGLAPDVFTYTSLIEACYKSNWPEIANGLWSRMVLKGCLPNIATFNVRIQFLVNKGRTWDANKLLDFMRRLKKSPEFPDEITYNLVIKGFCKMGNLKMAMYVYSAFRSEGYKPNQKIYQTLIHYFCEAREFDMAYNMCKQSMENNWYPSVGTINNLIEGLVRDGKLEKLDKAKHIYSLSLKRKPPFNPAQIELMKSIVSRK
ncbi:pentatricopeptide repeat-containing protein At1g80150, mitochondrial-like isoform X2 [Salvia hispanica]|uniref:pentatricopeptide repeat-containing protein At1g80150, mitochondrial-like isoform X2 n=1 Tax=Salvia hispanica TaxID=49212 RepID=UPI002009C880|nr:pentatricopeptide repeat-containing protein At1g80150, mitochondrial-like isoform X2 [Salvia hispanica]